MVKIRQLALIFALFALVLIVGCGDSGSETAVTVIPPTATTDSAPVAETAVVEEVSAEDQDYIIIATDAPNPPFADFDEFGHVIGFNESIMSSIAEAGGFTYEFVVTPYEGVLTSLANGSDEFDAVMPPMPIPDAEITGVVYTNPYLEIGQVLLVLADNEEITSPRNLGGANNVGVVRVSYGELTARTDLNIPANNLNTYENATEAVQALVDGEVTAVILDNYTGSYFAETYPEQLKLATGAEHSSWLSERAFAIAVAEDNPALLERLNQAIAQLQANNGLDRMTALLIDDESERPLDPGEPRTGTSAEELVIGMVGQLTNLDPAMPPDLINWELKMNTMSGLYMVNSDNQIVPLLATSMPQISEDGLEYTIALRPDLQFPDGTDFTADDVVWSINRAKFGQGGYLVNRFLKDTDEDGYGDADAVQAVDANTVRIRLQEPTAYFPNVLATPPFFPISSECFANTEDLTSTCGGIGPYTIITWESDAIRLQANPNWPGSTPPAFAHIKVRFYETVADLRTSLEEFGSVDVAWTGLPYADFVDLQNMSDYQSWMGPAAFKSYLIFEQSQPPWNKRSLREAAALALDREALADIIFEGERLPLYSPVPDDVPHHIPALPERDLARAQFLLQGEGYTALQPLEITLWYLNDGRYTQKEEAYATAIKEQLEETGSIQVTLQSAPWENYRTQISACNYPAYLLGWPSVGSPVNYLDMTAWTDFFLENSEDVFCSNYKSDRMDDLVAKARAEQDPVQRQELNAQIQELWATDLPTLDITQTPRIAISAHGVANIKIDALGMLHYETLTKSGE